MSKGTETTTVDTEDRGIPKEDVLRSIEVIKAALSHRPFIREGVFGKKWMELSSEQRLEEMFVPRIGLFYPAGDESIPALFLRIVGTEFPLVEVFFYPIEAAWSFLDEGRNYTRKYCPEGWSSAEIEDCAFDLAVEMFLMMIDNLYNRSLLMMESFTRETIALWYFNKDQKAQGGLAAIGESNVKPKATVLKNVIKAHGGHIQNLWLYHGQSGRDWQKVQLANNYEDLYPHWVRLFKMVSNDDRDWDQYSKAGRYADTPDDLIEKLHNVDRSDSTTIRTKVSELALEHAARRAELVKRHGVSQWARTKRRAGVLVSDYSAQQLFQFLKEGRALKLVVEESSKMQESMSKYPEPESSSDPALIKKRKLLEQKLDFALEKNSDTQEQDRVSAKEKKSEK
jgi:hypothetical protein